MNNETLAHNDEKRVEQLLVDEEFGGRIGNFDGSSAVERIEDFKKGGDRTETVAMTMPQGSEDGLGEMQDVAGAGETLEVGKNGTLRSDSLKKLKIAEEEMAENPADLSNYMQKLSDDFLPSMGVGK